MLCASSSSSAAASSSAEEEEQPFNFMIHNFHVSRFYDSFPKTSSLVFLSLKCIKYPKKGLTIMDSMKTSENRTQSSVYTECNQVVLSIFMASS